MTFIDGPVGYNYVRPFTLAPQKNFLGGFIDFLGTSGNFSRTFSSKISFYNSEVR